MLRRLKPDVFSAAVCAVLAGSGIAPAAARSTERSPACLAYDVQREVEVKALAITKSPEVQKARAEAGAKWKAGWGKTTPNMETQFAAALDELVFNAALRTVTMTMWPSKMIMGINGPHVIDGTYMPGSRWGWDNTDNVYGTIPVDPRSFYRIAGTMSDSDTNLNLSTWTADGKVLSNLSRPDIKTDRHGRFEITVGGKSVQEAANHIRLPLDANHIMIRETLADWAKSRPVHLAVEQVGGPKRPIPPPSVLAQEAAATVFDMVDKMFAWRKSLYWRLPANEFSNPRLGQSDGGLSNQAYSFGNFQIEGDEAVLFDINTAGAKYFSFQLSNLWGTSGDFVNNTSTLTNLQSHRNEDGTYTYVLSIKDPGIQNWISTQGWREGDITLRWQRMTPVPGSDGGPSVKVRRIKLSQLPSNLPAGTPKFTASERALQIAARARNPYALWAPPACGKGR
jgi:hypothetical protein